MAPKTITQMHDRIANVVGKAGDMGDAEFFVAATTSISRMMSVAGSWCSTVCRSVLSIRSDIMSADAGRETWSANSSRRVAAAG